MKNHLLFACFSIWLVSACMNAEEPQSLISRGKEAISSRLPNKNTSATQSVKIADLQSRINRQKEEIENLRKALVSEREEKLKSTEALNALRRIAAILGINTFQKTSVLGLESDIKIKLDSICYVPQKRLSSSQLTVISDLLADEPTLFHVIENYHQFIISLGAGRLIHIPDIPRGNP